MVNLLEDILALRGYEDCREPSLGYSCCGLKKDSAYFKYLKRELGVDHWQCCCCRMSVTPQSFLPCSKCHPISHTFLNSQTDPATYNTESDWHSFSWICSSNLPPCYIECHSGVLASDSNISILHIPTWFHFMEAWLTIILVTASCP